MGHAQFDELHTDPGDQKRIDTAIGEILDRLVSHSSSLKMSTADRNFAFGRFRDLVIEERMRAFDRGKTAVATSDPDQRDSGRTMDNHRDPFDYPRTVDDTRMRGLEERIDMMETRVQWLENPRGGPSV